MKATTLGILSIELTSMLQHFWLSFKTKRYANRKDLKQIPKMHLMKASKRKKGYYQTEKGNLKNDC